MGVAVNNTYNVFFAWTWLLIPHLSPQIQDWPPIHRYEKSEYPHERSEDSERGDYYKLCNLSLPIYSIHVHHQPGLRFAVSRTTRCVSGRSLYSFNRRPWVCSWSAFYNSCPCSLSLTTDQCSSKNYLRHPQWFYKVSLTRDRVYNPSSARPSNSSGQDVVQSYCHRNSSDLL